MWCVELSPKVLYLPFLTRSCPGLFGSIGGPGFSRLEYENGASDATSYVSQLPPACWGMTVYLESSPDIAAFSYTLTPPSPIILLVVRTEASNETAVVTMVIQLLQLFSPPAIKSRLHDILFPLPQSQKACRPPTLPYVHAHRQGPQHGWK